MAPISAGVLRSLSMELLTEFVLACFVTYDEEELRTGKRTFEKRKQIASKLRPKKRITTALLTEVAEMYKKAEAAGEWPIVAVKERMGVSRSTAAAYVGMARSHEPPLLPPARARRSSKKEDNK